MFLRSNLTSLILGYGTFFALGSLACQACGDPPKDCFESCDEDDDCGSSMICGSNGCVPDTCKECFDSGRTCYTDPDGDTCTYSHCG